MGGLGDGVDSQMSFTQAPDGGSRSGSPQKLRVELIDSRPKKPSGPELIRDNVKELYEVIAYMDYSFERAFTIQEKEFMLAYKHHAKEIQDEINAYKPKSSSAQEQAAKKEEKILMF